MGGGNAAKGRSWLSRIRSSDSRVILYARWLAFLQARTVIFTKVQLRRLCSSANGTGAVTADHLRTTAAAYFGPPAPRCVLGTSHRWSASF
jgi:hypothetical protein